MQRHKRFAWTWAVAGVWFEAPRGATPAAFYARGATGDVLATFLEGMGPTTGGFGLKLEEVPLTTEPKRYTIGACRVSDGRGVGGFAGTPAPTRPNGA